MPSFPLLVSRDNGKTHDEVTTDQAASASSSERSNASSQRATRIARREVGRITSADIECGEHGLTTWLHIEFATGVQGFGGLRFDPVPGDRARGAFGAYVKGIMTAVGVVSWAALAGKRVVALFDSPLPQATIVGLECAYEGAGGTFSVRAWEDEWVLPFVSLASKNS